MRFWSCESIAVSERVQSDTVISVFKSDIRSRWEKQWRRSTRLFTFSALNIVYVRFNEKTKTLRVTSHSL